MQKQAALSWGEMGLIAMIVVFVLLAFRLYFRSLAADWHKENIKSQLELMRKLEKGDAGYGERGE